MTIIYFDCGMGAAGDMLNGALLDLMPEYHDEFLATMNGLGLADVEISTAKVERCGTWGTKFNVTIAGQVEQSVDVDLADPHVELTGSGHSHEHSHAHDHVSAHDHSHTHDHSHGHEHHHDHPHHHDHGDTHSHSHAHPHEHSHDLGHIAVDGHGASLREIDHLLSELDLPEPVITDARAVYRIIGEAEASVHDIPVEDIHFHEVGMMDAIADVVGFCLLMHTIDHDHVYASPINVGSGHVRAAHGVMPVPAPATLEILTGVPIYSGAIKAELCTPTGAALLKHFVDRWERMPELTVRAIGYGMGTKEFEVTNAVRVLHAESHEINRDTSIAVLQCTVDDMTGEDIGFATETLLESGALDVYTTPVMMKKSRPGVLLTCLAPSHDMERFCDLIFKHTSTIGVRYRWEQRETMSRTTMSASTPWGEVSVKKSRKGEIQRRKPEFDDVARLARINDVSLADVRRTLDAD